MTRTPTTHQQRLHTLIEDPRTRARWAPRSRRRRAVVLLAVLVLAGAVLFTLAPLSTEPLSYPLLGGFVVAMALSAYVATKINIAARWVATYRGLDEFQCSEANRASILGHHVTSVLLVLLVAVAGAIGGLLTSQGLSVNVGFALLLPLVLVTAMCHASFPACYLAWTRPDEILDDEDEPDHA